MRAGLWQTRWRHSINIQPIPCLKKKNLVSELQLHELRTNEFEGLSGYTLHTFFKFKKKAYFTDIFEIKTPSNYSITE